MYLKKLVNKIGPNWICAEKVAHAAFGETDYNEPTNRNVYEIGLKKNQTKETIIKAIEVPVICATMRQPTIPKTAIE